MPGRNNIYFASDFHLGADDNSRVREQKVVKWLSEIQGNAKAVYLLGDIFDFWFEYRYVVPKGYLRLLGKLAELTDNGVELHLFTGNHDVWMFDYFEKELNASVHHNPVTINEFGYTLMIGHGDGLGPGDRGFKIIKSVFTNKMAQRCFALLHPYLGISLAQYFSRKSRESTGEKDAIYLGDDKEFLVQYCHEILKKEHIDYFIFGHRHMLLDKKIGSHSRYLNLGEWFTSCNYAILNQDGVELNAFQG